MLLGITGSYSRLDKHLWELSYQKAQKKFCHKKFLCGNVSFSDVGNLSVTQWSHLLHFRFHNKPLWKTNQKNENDVIYSSCKTRGKKIWANHVNFLWCEVIDYICCFASLELNSAEKDPFSDAILFPLKTLFALNT